MGKQSKLRKAEWIDKGKVTPIQIAFIVDRYLSDNSYTQTRSTFRSEVSHLISKSPVQEAPKSLLSLGAILDDYIALKEQKVWIDQERLRLEQEKLRVQNLLRGMQDVMNTYNADGNDTVTRPQLLPPPAVPSGAMVSQAELAVVTLAGHYPAYKNPALMSTSRPLNIRKDLTNFSTPVPSHAPTKRKASKDASSTRMMVKRSQRCIQPKDVNLSTQSSHKEKNKDKSLTNSTAVLSDIRNVSPLKGSNVVKCLFNQKLPSPSPNPSVPKTAPFSSSSQTDKSISPLEFSSMATSSKEDTPRQFISTKCTIISSETICVSPTKEIGVAYYSIEKKDCVSTCSPVKISLKRSDVKDHVKGRLDFGASDTPMIPENQTPECTSTSESEKDGNILGLDFLNLDALGMDLSLSEFLVDLDIEGEGLDLSSQQVLDSSPDSDSGSLNMPGRVDVGARQVTASPYLSNVAGILGQKDMNSVGVPDSVTTMRPITKSIKILSPVKTQQRSLDQEN